MVDVHELIEKRIAQVREALGPRVNGGERKIPDRVTVGDTTLSRRERYAMRRYTRQLTSTVRKDADREVLYLDPALARGMAVKGLVTLLHNRKPADMLFGRGGQVIWRNIEGRQRPAIHVESIPTERGKALMDALQRMKGD